LNAHFLNGDAKVGISFILTKEIAKNFKGNLQFRKEKSPGGYRDLTYSKSMV